MRNKPPWLVRRLPPAGQRETVMAIIEDEALHTVCQEAHCPNQMECYSRGTATFLLLGPGCTRRCTFCTVDKSAVQPPDKGEPSRTAEAVAQLKLNYCVLTMVTRDDLQDGGAGHVAQTVLAIREKCPSVRVEVLISDLSGNWDALETVLATEPQVLNHNVETVPRLYATVRPQADYRRSLHLLSRASESAPSVVTKSGLMLGLGETRDELLKVMDDLRETGCHLLTLGQYLAPSAAHHPVIRYVPPEEFEEFRQEALTRGFCEVASSPYVRSSYQADRLYGATRDRPPQM
ncbi:MAG: lipoyl synthase [Desulfobacteraceae bacterium]